VFKLGQRVVCTNGIFSPPPPYGEIVPVMNRSYTIRNVVGQCVRLREITNRPNEYQEGIMECLFRADRFQARKGKP
jgi:hypothetical protein